MYKVYDSLGNFMKEFPTLEQATNYKVAFGNANWRIEYPKACLSVWKDNVLNPLNK